MESRSSGRAGKRETPEARTPIGSPFREVTSRRQAPAVRLGRGGV